MSQRILAGPPPGANAETLADHERRLGPRPTADGLIPVLDASGLLGRGGAGFPVARKWATVAERGEGRAVVLANGAEGEPLSAKDRAIMTLRPHLVLDGAELAADAVGADRIIVYVGGQHRAAMTALERAIDERAAGESRWLARVPIELIDAPPTYVAGEESAAVHYIEAGDARPTTVPPRPFDRGVDGRPTLVQNVETLAHVALIARFGDGWYRELGSGVTRGSALVTVGGGVSHPGVIEIAMGTSVREVAASAGTADGIGAVLLGGYFGGWLRAHEAWDLPLDPVMLRSSGSAFGCGVVYLLPPDVVRRPGHGPDPRLHGRPERRTVRPMRLRAAVDRRRGGTTRRPAVRGRARPRTPGPLVRSAGRSGRLQAPRRRGRAAAQRAPRVRRRIRPSRAGRDVQPARATWASGMMAGPTVTTLAVDRIVCDGYGICAELLPELIDLDDWGYPIVSAEPVQPSLRDHAQRAVAMCPVLALSLRSAQGPPAAPALRQDRPARLAGADRSIRRPRRGSQTPAPGRGSGARRERTWRRP